MKRFAGLLLLTAITGCYAGRDGLTWTSRANCLNNESVIWDQTHDSLMGAVSIHEHWRESSPHHVIDSNGKQDSFSLEIPYASTWRAGAVHWGEGAFTDYWYVIGRFKYADAKGKMIRVDDDASGCRLYDGWYADDPVKDKEERDKNPKTIAKIIPHKAIASEKYKVSIANKPLLSLFSMKNDTLYNVIKRSMDNAKAQGYVNQDSQHANFLLGLKNKTFAFTQKSDYASSSMRKNLSDIQLSFIYKSDFIKNVIGYAPINTWHDGWTGFATFFEDKDLGVCEMQVTALADSKANITLDQDKITHKVGDRPAFAAIEGNKEAYEYTISWWDDVYFNEFTCASNTLEKSKLDKMADFARQYEEAKKQGKI